MPTLPVTPEWLRASAGGAPVGVDRENKRINGFVVAQLGPFKTPGRGQFNLDSLKKIVLLINQQRLGLKSRFAHPTESDDGLGKFLGRLSNARLDGDKVRGDLQLSETAFNTPSGDLGTYLLDLADEDPDALSSSLVLQTEKVYTLDENGRRKKGEDGEDLPPLWIPTKLHASDVVETGDAVDGLLGAKLSTDGLPDAVLRRGVELLEKQFDGQTREVIRARCLSFLDKYLAWKFPGEWPGEAIDDDEIAGVDEEDDSGELAADRRGIQLFEAKAKARERSLPKTP